MADTPTVVAAITGAATTIGTAIAGFRNTADLQKQIDAIKLSIVGLASDISVRVLAEALGAYKTANDAKITALEGRASTLERFVTEYQRETRNEAAEERERTLVNLVKSLADKVDHLTIQRDPPRDDPPRRTPGRY